jgi:hypothetical protein
VLAAIDLTCRQTARVLEQALRTRAQVELEPRSRQITLCGSLTGRESGVLRIDLHDHGRDWPLTGLVGAFCDVKMVLSGDLHQFCTCIVDAVDNALPQYLLLAAPEVIQVANRRRFERQPLREPTAVQLWVAGATSPMAGTLINIAVNGLACRLPRREAEEMLLIDDEVRLRFQLPGQEAACDVPARVCVKTASGRSEYLQVGLEFCTPPPGDPAQPTLDRLRAVLFKHYTNPPNAENPS